MSQRPISLPPSPHPHGWVTGSDVLVTGATGFVGTNLLLRLRDLGARPRAVMRPGSRSALLPGLDVAVVESELEDRGALQHALAGCAACIHLAAAIGGDAETLRRVNVAGTQSVLEEAAASGCPRIVHVSTMGTLSRTDGEPVRETDQRLASGASDYARTKFLGELVARDLARRGAPISIVHPAAPVGPYDHKPTVTGQRIRTALAGKVPPWISGRINHVAVSDVVEGILLAAGRGTPGQSYLLAFRDGNLNLAQFLSLVAAAAGIRAPRLSWREQCRRWWRAAFPPGGRAPRDLACDPSWTISQLGLPQTPLAGAFASAVQWLSTAHPRGSVG